MRRRFRYDRLPLLGYQASVWLAPPGRRDHRSTQNYAAHQAPTEKHANDLRGTDAIATESRALNEARPAMTSAICLLAPPRGLRVQQPVTSAPQDKVKLAAQR